MASVLATSDDRAGMQGGGAPRRPAHRPIVWSSTLHSCGYASVPSSPASPCSSLTRFVLCGIAESGAGRGGTMSAGNREAGTCAQAAAAVAAAAADGHV